MAVLDFLPLFRETVDTVRARVDADMNAGVDPTDPAFIDTTEGGIAYDLTQPVVIEIVRLYDALATEYPAAATPLFAFGTYLDYWGDVVDVPRKDATFATGVVRFTGTIGRLVATGTQVSTLQTDPNVDPPEFAVTGPGGVIPAGGFIDLPVQAVRSGTEGNVAAGTVVVLETPNADIAAVTNLAAITAGTEVETDDSYSDRILLEFSQPPGAGNQADYIRWALAYPGIGHATVQPLWNGAGTVRVIVTDDDNNPVSGVIVSGLQALLDPVPQQGAGQAPIGALVTVATPTPVTINVSATVTFEGGYSLDGTGGTVAVRQAIVDAITDYVNGLGPGQEVVFRHLEARFFQVQGVHDVSNLLINGVGQAGAGGGNQPITGLQVADIGTVTLA
jgi:uncharacterized phage protein gp47/JayE